MFLGQIKRSAAGVWVWVLLALALATGVCRVKAGVLISEFMAINASGLTDQDGDHSDWIELHNDSPDPVELTGWHLTDSPGNLAMWTFPATRISGDGYLIVFASGEEPGHGRE